MSVSDWSTLAVAVLTFLALLVALITFRRQLGSPAKLEMSVGQEIILHYDKFSNLILTANFAFINKGSLPGIVTEISAIIYQPESTKEQPKPFRWLLWRTFEATTTFRGEGGNTGWWTRSTGPVHTLVVPSRAAGESGIARKIRLYEDPRMETGSTYETGPLPQRDSLVTYHAKFYAREGMNRVEVCRYSCDLAIDPGFQERMQDECTEKGATFKGRLVLRRKPVTDTRTPNVQSSRDLFESVEIRDGY